MDHAELLWKALRQRQLRHEQEASRNHNVQAVNHANLKLSVVELQAVVKRLEQRVATLENLLNLLMDGKEVG